MFITIEVSLLLGLPKTELENIIKHTNPWIYTHLDLFLHLYDYIQIKDEFILMFPLKSISQDSF